MAEPSPGAGTPRWVKVFGVIAVALILLFVVIQFTGVGGGHGPGRHTPSGDVGSKDLPSSVALSVGTEIRIPPEGGHG